MPVKVVQSEVTPPFPVNSKQVSRYQITCRLITTHPKLYFYVQPGVSRTLLYNGSRFTGHQKSKGNQYDVEVMLQVSAALTLPSLKRRSTRRFVITKKAPTRAFSWLKVPTSAFTFKTLLASHVTC